MSGIPARSPRGTANPAPPSVTQGYPAPLMTTPPCWSPSRTCSGSPLLGASTPPRSAAAWHRDPCGWDLSMRKYVIMGVQGSGKGTQSKMLCSAYDMVHLSVGDLFRWHVQNHTKLGAQVKRTMNAGELVGDDQVQDVVRWRLDQHDWNYGFV